MKYILPLYAFVVALILILISYSKLAYIKMTNSIGEQKAALLNKTFRTGGYLLLAALFIKVLASIMAHGLM